MSKVLLRERASQICVSNPRYSKSIKGKKKGEEQGRCSLIFHLTYNSLQSF